MRKKKNRNKQNHSPHKKKMEENQQKKINRQSKIITMAIVNSNKNSNKIPDLPTRPGKQDDQSKGKENLSG